MMKHDGLRWAARAQFARRGGLKGTKLQDIDQSIGGFIHDFRESNMEKENTKKGWKGAPLATAGGYPPGQSDMFE